MKKLIFILTLALCAGAVQAQVKFETKSTDAVREMAVKQGKLVFIDLYADWCPPCRMMEREVFSRKDVGEFMDQRFVAAKYNTDKSTGRDLLKKYGSGSIPLYLVFDTEGELLGRITGAADAETFMDNLRTIIARQKPLKKLPLTACRRGNAVQQRQIDRRGDTSRHPAKQKLPEREKPGVYQHMQSPAAPDQSGQRGRGDGNVTPDGEPLDEMHHEMHAEGEEQRQPRTVAV